MINPRHKFDKYRCKIHLINVGGFYGKCKKVFDLYCHSLSCPLPPKLLYLIALLPPLRVMKMRLLPRLRQIFPVIFLLVLAASQALAQGSAGSSASIESRYVIDAPTAGMFPHVVSPPRFNRRRQIILPLQVLGLNACRFSPTRFLIYR